MVAAPGGRLYRLENGFERPIPFPVQSTSEGGVFIIGGILNCQMDQQGRLGWGNTVGLGVSVGVGVFGWRCRWS